MWYFRCCRFSLFSNMPGKVCWSSVHVAQPQPLRVCIIERRATGRCRVHGRVRFFRRFVDVHTFSTERVPILLVSGQRGRQVGLSMWTSDVTCATLRRVNAHMPTDVQMWGLTCRMFQARMVFPPTSFSGECTQLSPCFREMHKGTRFFSVLLH